MGRRVDDGARRGILAVLLAVVAGCAEELGPDRPETTTVTGVVRDGNAPASGGWIEFIPVDGTLGKLRSAPLGADGTFRATGVPIGTVAVGLVATRTRRTDPRLFDTLGTPIRREVRPGGRTTLDIDLVDEKIRFQAEWNARNR